MVLCFWDGFLMVLISRRSNKIGGTIFLILGILSTFYLYYSFKTQSLVLDQYSFFLLKYFKIILCGYFGMFCIAFGVLYFIGFLTPYYAANPYEKAKGNVFTSIFGIPILMLFIMRSFDAYRNIDTKIYGILGALWFSVMIIFCIWQIYSGLNTVKEFHRKKYRMQFYAFFKDVLHITKSVEQTACRQRFYVKALLTRYSCGPLLTLNVIAPSKARRILQGESSCLGEISNDLF